MTDPLDALLPATTASPEATLALGEALAAHLGPGDVVALYGDLGAGKTHLVKGLARGLGADADEVTSPTFTLVQTYEGRAPLIHLDLYRLEREAELDALGLDELLGTDAVAAVEWPERAEAWLPPATLRLRLTHAPDGTRRVERLAAAPEAAPASMGFAP